jgi:hypothetical protein
MSSEKHLLCFALVFRHNASRTVGRAEARPCGANCSDVVHIVAGLALSDLWTSARAG